jgi:hypothetical protein
MGFANIFIGCSLFDMYVKEGNKKIWHEMITFVCDSRSYAKMNKYIIISIFLGLILVIFNSDVIFKYGFSQNTNVRNPHYCCYGGRC